MGMTKSKIGYVNDKVPWYYGWNPGGFGCSAHCMAPAKCWSEQMCHRAKCPDCKAFRVHLHPERLDWPAKTKKPGVALVNFTCDTWDQKRPVDQISSILLAAKRAPWHTYVWLTQQAERLKFWHAAPRPNWYLGLTIRTQAEADERLPIFLQIPGKLWISYEPAWEELRLGDICPLSELASFGIQGVIVGHDNRRCAPGVDTLDHIRDVVRQCTAAEVPVYVKQIWTDISGPIFLRASHPHEYDMFPADLKHRDLPWTMPEGPKENAKDGPPQNVE